jgi:hypothetical protein
VPQTWTPVKDRDGEQYGWKLPSGEILKPWLLFEVQRNEEYVDLSPAELATLGVEVMEYTTNRVVPIAA